MIFLAVWSEAFAFFIAADGKVVPDDASNPITMAYNWAQLVSTLTDRALWLFFLGLILAIAWIMDRRKDRQLDEYRKWERTNAERLAKLIEGNATCMEHLTEEMKEMRELMNRIERRLER
jgi:hypothetical protein